MLDPTTIFALAVCAVAFMVTGAYLYQRGAAKASVMPSLIDRLVNAPAKPTEAPKPVCPITTCPFCKQRPRWILANDESEWVCSKCERSISGPKPRILP